MSFLENINISKQAKEWGIPFWQHPQFLFLIMGILIATTDIASYLISIRYITNFALVIILLCVTTIFLFVITYIVQGSFERMAEASRMKTEFVSVISHQLRTPVTNLSWALDYIKNSALSQDKELAEYLKILEANTERMKDIVNNLIIVSRLDSKKLSLAKEQVDLCKLAEDAIKRVKNLAAAKRITIRQENSFGELSAETDPFYLMLIMENLVANGIRYGKDGGEVIVRIGKERDGVYFFVKDNGVGIPAKDQKYIFQKFFRASNIRQKVAEGTGLGLFMSNMVAKKLGCRINFASEEGKGATFWIKIPLD